MSTDKDTRYNGWTNYETWAVALWLDNEQGSYNHWRERAQEAYNEAEAGKHYASQTREDAAKIALCDELKQWHEDYCEESGIDDKLGGTVFADLMNAALGEVNWYEIAEHYLAGVDKAEAGNGSEVPR